MNPPSTKSNRPALIFGVITGFACLGLVLMNSRSRKELELQRRETANLQAELASANLKVSSISAERAKARQPQENPGSPDAASRLRAPSLGKAASKRQVDPEEMSALMKSSVMQTIMASRISAETQATYGDLMDRLQLSPEERDFMQSLLVEKQTNLQNLAMKLMNPALSDEDRSALQKKLAEAWQSGEAKIHDFLHDDADFASYKNYSQQGPERKEIGMFEALLKDGESLPAPTSDALAKLQNDARKNFNFTVDFYDQRNFCNPAVLNTNSVQTFLDEQTRFQAQIAEQASGLLTPAQLEAFRQNQAAVRQMAGMQLSNIVQMAGGQ